MARPSKAKDIFSSPIASFFAIVIAVLWTVPTFGLLVSSFRPEKEINNSGWWEFFIRPEVTLDNYISVLFEGSTTNPPLAQFFFNSFALTIPAVVFPITLALFRCTDMSGLLMAACVTAAFRAAPVPLSRPTTTT